MLTVTGLAIGAIVGHDPWGGPEVLAFSHGHGVVLGDLFALGTWGLGMFCCWRLWRAL